MPKVSVIIPTYNRAKLLPRAVNSVLNQTFKDFELIIVDDASTDNTEEVVRRYKDHRIKYIRHKTNKGISISTNEGINKSKGQYIAFQDSDDEWLPEKLKKQMEIITCESNIGVVYTGYIRISPTKKDYLPSKEVIRKNGNLHHDLLRENFIAKPTTLIPKKVLDEVGLFDENISQLVDWEFFFEDF